MISDNCSKLLFRMSSELPPKMLEAARAEGHKLKPKARGVVLNADPTAIVRFLDIGTHTTCIGPKRIFAKTWTGHEVTDSDIRLAFHIDFDQPEYYNQISVIASSSFKFEGSEDVSSAHHDCERIMRVDQS